MPDRQEKSLASTLQDLQRALHFILSHTDKFHVQVEQHVVDGLSIFDERDIREGLGGGNGHEVMIPPL